MLLIIPGKLAILQAVGELQHSSKEPPHLNFFPNDTADYINSKNVNLFSSMILPLPSISQSDIE